jgi:hypothetical protein
VQACTVCSNDIDEGDERQFPNGDIVCDSCSYYCDSCTNVIPQDESRVNGSSIYCYDCSFVCENCDEAHENDDVHTVNDEYWCQSCYQDNSFYCDSCDSNYPDRWDYYSVQDNTYCSSCFDSHAYWCEECDQNFRDDDPCSCRSDEGRCPSCNTREAIHSYGCKPDLNFLGNDKSNLYLGLELETEIYGDLNDASEFASEALAGVAILKHDGSIGRQGGSRVGNEGFEIVTQPHTHLQFREHSQALWDTIDKLRTDYRARSWDAKSNCGIHIHISRRGFSSGAHTHRFLSLVYQNSEQMMKFAGRKSDYARFNDCYSFDEYDRPVFSLKHKLDRNAHTERYTAVNTQNRDTLELRFFRGTMNSKGVLATLDLAHAMVEYTRNLRLDDVKMGALKWEWFVDYVQDNNGLYPDLYNRIPKVAGTVINDKTELNA